MTAEEAITELHWIHNHGFKYPSDLPGTESIIESIDMAISALESQRWIPVDERMPNPLQEVFVLATVNGIKEFGIAIWSGKRWFSGQICCKQDDIKFWIPFPQPPKEEG